MQQSGSRSVLLGLSQDLGKLCLGEFMLYRPPTLVFGLDVLVAVTRPKNLVPTWCINLSDNKNTVARGPVGLLLRQSLQTL